ncbi:MAG TPA: amylo-alpha-1,6-glucosidase [Planctomycetaceae bacterium]|nr:amylo-alpha-1,6-glucosidase [Planctomycetaceae bacterium]
MNEIAVDRALPDLSAEWLEADGLGGFASGTVGGFRTRRYHALLLTARRPPTERMVLVNGFEAWIETATGRFALSTQHYAPDVFHPDGQQCLLSFTIEPWPTWHWRLDDGTVIELELFVPHERSLTVLSWSLGGGEEPVRLVVRPLMSGRDYHALHRENPAFQFAAADRGQTVTVRPYSDVPAVAFRSNGRYRSEPMWYRQFLYAAEQERGLDCIEDLASPGTFAWELDSRRPAIWMLAAQGHESESSHDIESAHARLRSAELARRQQFPTPLHRAADAYLVRRGTGKTIVAGYPWFTDWGRDTFLAMRGLCLATGRLDEAGQLLESWAATVSEGMLPNRFPDHGDQPEFNSVDASLWYVIAVHEYFQASKLARRSIARPQRTALQRGVTAILDGYSRGTRFGIHCDTDGLLAAGVPGMQLTWMDAKIGDWVVTPRTGKPVEIQALWLNALSLAGLTNASWRDLFERGLRSFEERFWNPAAECLFDVVDVDHRPGNVDAAIRPNQILAVGGLPVSLIGGERARRIVDTVESELLTPLGLRTLSPNAPDYAARCTGGVRERDGAYHQGTVWPWLIGPFVDAWVRVRGGTPDIIRAARERFLPPLHEHLLRAGLGHISEIADGDPPHTPRGCPFQAWSLSELLRLELQVLSDDRRPEI